MDRQMVILRKTGAKCAFGIEEKYVTSPRPLLSGIPACRASHAFAQKKTARGWEECHLASAPAQTCDLFKPLLPGHVSPEGHLCRMQLGRSEDSHLVELAQCCHGQGMSLRTMRAGGYRGNSTQLCRRKLQKLAEGSLHG